MPLPLSPQQHRRRPRRHGPARRGQQRAAAKLEARALAQGIAATVLTPRARRLQQRPRHPRVACAGRAARPGPWHRTVSGEELLLDWERDHLAWDANDLLAKLRTWQLGDVSANERYQGSFERALGAIRARAILVPCATDLYFPPEDNAIEAKHMPNAELRPYDSPWGHCAATPSREGSGFMRFLNACVSELLAG